MDGIQEAIWQVLSTILIAFAGIAVRYIKQWAESKEINEKLKGKEYIVRWVVEGIEQVYQYEEGSKKKEIAKKKAIDMLNANGLNVSVVELDSLIESIMFEINSAKRKESEAKEDRTLDDIV